jgi:hypothetical protein
MRRDEQELGGGWSYRVTSEPDAQHVTVAARRDDEPAALPLVTASGSSLGDALANLRESIAGYQR